jgi:hypothetical protein
MYNASKVHLKKLMLLLEKNHKDDTYIGSNGAALEELVDILKRQGQF